jgi:hypothetical protein
MPAAPYRCRTHSLACQGACAPHLVVLQRHGHVLGRPVASWAARCRAVAELGPSKLCQRLAEYQYVIHEDQDKLPHVLLKYDIHQILES